MPCGATEARASYERGQDRDAAREKRAEPYDHARDRIEAVRALIRGAVSEIVLRTGTIRMGTDARDRLVENAAGLDEALGDLFAEARDKADAIMRGDEE